MNRENKSVRPSPSPREFVLAIRSVQAILKHSILPKGVNEKDAFEKWNSLSLKYPVNAEIFKEVLRCINRKESISPSQISQWNRRIENPNEYIGPSEYLKKKFPSTFGTHKDYSYLRKELFAMERETEFKDDFIAKENYGMRKALYSIKMLDEGYRRILERRLTM